MPFLLQRRNSFNQGAKRLKGRGFRAEKEDSIRRTVYVSEIYWHVSAIFNQPHEPNLPKFQSICSVPCADS